LFGHVLQQVSVRTRPHRFEYRFIVIQRGQHQYLSAGKRPRDLARGRHTAQPRHVQIHENYIGTQLNCHRDRFDSIAGLTHHLHILLHGQQHGGASPDQRLIFRDQDANPRCVVRLFRIH
jgi:hypothetical protein